MNALHAYQFQFHPLRIEQDEAGNPWFCAKDACAILGYANHNKAIKDHCKADGVTNRYPIVDTLGRTQYPAFINEGNLYRLIIKSNKPEAERFESWVCDDVLPTIRRTGQYQQALQHEPERFWVTLEEWVAAQASAKDAKSNLKATRVLDEVVQGKRQIANADERLNKLLNMQESIIRMQQQMLALPKPNMAFGQQRRWTPEEDAKADELRASGLGCTRIGYALNRSGDSVSNRFYLRAGKRGAQ